MIRLNLGLYISLSFTSFAAMADDNIFNIPLEDLLNIRVVIAGEREQDEFNSVSSVDKVTEYDWNQYQIEHNSLQHESF